ncbi:MAG: sulfatase [Phycisphaerae bacterium]|nr:sulfatase [Phycisphaerae bacterium]
MQRREFLRRVAVGSIAGTVLDQVAPERSALAGQRRNGKGDSRPNILFAISDDQSWVHTGAMGDPVVRTPTFDRVAREGVLFTHAFCMSPSCTPSRGAILTGQVPFRLQENGNLWSTLRKEYAVYPDLLEKAGYFVGHTRKGWGPGKHEPGGRDRNPASPQFKDFKQFMARRPAGEPFCFWFGGHDPHRPYKKGSGLESGKKLEDVKVPPFLPDVPEVRSDILDYYFEVERFDRDLGEIVAFLETAGELDNTIVVVTSDNGMPFPRAKANLYDYGTRMPLAIRWPARVRGGRRIDDFIGLADCAPTFLEAAGLPVPPEMTGRSFVDLLTCDKSGRIDPKRDKAFTGRERHAWVREGGLGYPCRAIRTDRYLYIRNFEPDHWPAGDPEGYGDVDGSPTKDYMLANRHAKRYDNLFRLAFAKRPEEELYDLKTDPAQMQNVAALPEYAEARKQLRVELDRWMTEMKDPRALGGGDVFDRYPYYGRARAL